MAYLDLFQQDPKQNNRFGFIVFLFCIVMIMLMASTCNGQQQIPRTKTDNYWHAYSIECFTQDGDTLRFGSAYYPTPYIFYQLTVKTSKKDKCVYRLLLVVTYKDGMIDYLSSHTPFNCEGVSWFEITPEELNRLRTKDVESISVTNNYNNHNFAIFGWDKMQYYKIALNN